MRDGAALADVKAVARQPSWLDAACAELTRCLSELLQATFQGDASGIGASIQFLDALTIPGSIDGDLISSGISPASAMGRIVSQLQLTETEVRLAVLAGMQEQHEGIADILRMINPAQTPYATLGLAAQLLCESAERRPFEAMVHSGSAVAAGLLSLDGDGPLYTRNVVLADRLWAVLQGHDSWPESLPRVEPTIVDWGLREWFDEVQVAQAIGHLANGADITVNLAADELQTALHRAACLVAQAGRSPAAFVFADNPKQEQLRLLSIHCLARGSVPIVGITPKENRPARLDGLGDLPGPVVSIQVQGQPAILPRQPLMQIDIERLGIAATEIIWQRALPGSEPVAAELAARFPVEPYLAAQVMSDLALTSDGATFSRIAEQIRARVGVGQQAGVKLVKPRCNWSDLILSSDRSSQLHEAVGRLKFQSRVINQWGFLRNRQGARGVRILLAGPPGTGKTLTAEVLGEELGVDLLIVDISRVVSKWIGETEKNLEEAFACAERTRSVLLFDEADAIFGKRTEVTDAHDRYANLETAYLLTRLDRFEGLAILSTNFRENIDSAFTRRMDYILDYEEPNRAERLQIWQCHVPENAPLADDVNLAEIAAVFPIVGGLIRNAAVGAAYLAAAEDRAISRAHLLRALRREYEKQGRSFPGAQNKLPT